MAYASTNRDAERFDTVVIGTLSILGRYAFAIFDLVGINLKCKMLILGNLLGEVNLKSQVKEKAMSLYRNNGRFMGVSLIRIISV